MVDDDARVLRALQRLLQRAHADNRWAGTVSEALELVAVSAPDLVVSDFNLGEGVDGVALLQQIQASHPRTKCVVHTGTTAARLPKSNTFPVLFKPVATAELLELVESGEVKR